MPIYHPRIMYHFRNRLKFQIRFLAYSNRTSLNEALTKKNSYWLTNWPNRKLLKCLQHQKRSLSQDTSTRRSFPSVEEIRKWAPAQVVGFLESGDELYLTNNDIEMIKKNRFAGEDLLLLKEEDLCYIGLSLGPAKRIARLIKEISRTSLIDKPSTNLVHIFVDNSNIWIEGKYTVGNLERLGTFDFDRGYYFKQLKIDYGKLLTTVQCGRKLGGAPFLVGSRPPPNDSLWSRIKDQGFEVNVFDWDIISHREKETDIELAASITETIISNDPGILIIIAGDRDYKPVIKRALKLNWTVETWFWNFGASSSLKSDTIFCPLDNCYRSFSYGLGPDDSEKNQALEITDGNLIQSLTNEDVLEWFNTLNLFGWWEWDGYRAVQFYFNSSKNLEVVKNWILHNYLEVRVQEKNQGKKIF